MKKFTALICIILILSMLLTGCASPEPEQTPEPTPEPIPVDATGRYALSKSGEATVSDVAFYSDYRTDDNCRVFYEIFVGSFSDSDGDGDTVKDPEGSSYGASNQTDSTVALQLGDGDSLYNYYKRLIMIRAANPEIARGEYEALNIPDSKLGGFVSTWNGSSVLVIHNTTISEKTLDLAKITELPFDTLAAVIGVGSETVYLALSSDLDPHPKIIGAHLDGTKLTIDAQTSVVLRISGGRNL